MKPVLLTALTTFLGGDNKPHPVEGIIILIVLVVVLVCFDKWVIRSGKTHTRHYKSNRILKRERSLSKRFGHSILQMVEIFCGAYFCRGVRSIDETFRKATGTEKRVGGCFMALWPLVLALMTNHTDSFGAMVDSMMYGRHWMGWLYLGYMALIGSALFFAIKIAPKIPLLVSVPAAVASWLFLAWTVWTHGLI